MPKKFIQRFLPSSAVLKEHKHLRWLGQWLHDGNLWHLNRTSVANAAAAGLFVAFLPMPFQMALSAVLAILIRGNLAIAIALVWLSNPLTMVPIFYVAYKLGGWLLGMPASPVEFQASIEWLWHEFNSVGKPFLVGSLALGALSAFCGYFLTHILWRLHIIRYIRNRRNRPKPI